MLPPLEAISCHFPYKIARAERSQLARHFPDSGSTAIARGVAGHPGLAAESDANAAGVLMGVVTDWDIAKASATACAADVPVDEIMSREVITARPDDNVIEVVRKLETHEISAMPVVAKGAVVGVVSSDILAHKTLYRLLKAQA